MPADFHRSYQRNNWYLAQTPVVLSLGWIEKNSIKSKACMTKVSSGKVWPAACEVTAITCP